nr:hypothetical protein [Tanacetum cinerariifolium]
MCTFSPMMVANSRKHHCRVRPYTREVLVISTNLDIQKNHFPLDFTNRRGVEARIKNTWANTMYHNLYLGENALVDKENVGLDLTKSDLCPSFVEDLTTKGMGLCMTDSHTGNHHKYDFIKEEFAHFLELYHIPSKYSVMLPKRNQTIFDDPDGYVRLYSHCFSLENLRLPLTQFFCDVLQGFFNSFPGGKWLTFAKRPKKHIPNLLPKAITHIKGWKDKLPENIHKNPFFQRVGGHPTNVYVFPDPILFMTGMNPSWEHGQQRPMIIVDGKEMAFKNFMYAKTDEDLSFLLKEPRIGDAKPMVQIVKNTADSGDSSRQGEFVIHPRSVAETAKYGKSWYDEDVHDLRSVETEFPTIVFNDNLTSDETLSCEPTTSSLNDNEIDFRISFDESDDEDYMNFLNIENEFSTIIYNDALTSKSDFLTEPTINPQHIDEFNLKDETSLSECDEDSKSDKENDDD